MEERDIGLLERVNQGYSNLWKLLIQPQRATYDIYNLGPQVRSIGNKLYKRHDFQVRSIKGYRIECSYFEPMKGDKLETASWSTGLGNSDGLVQTESLNSESSE